MPRTCAVDAVPGALFVEFEEPPCHLVEASEDLCDRQPELVALYVDCVMVYPLVSTHFPCAFGVVPPLITLLGLHTDVGSPEMLPNPCVDPRYDVSMGGEDDTWTRGQ